MRLLILLLILSIGKPFGTPCLKQLSPHRRATAAKVIHRHLPTQAKLFRQGRVAMTSLCPRCLTTEETNAHVYCCSNLDAIKQRKSDWLALWKILHRNKTATIIEQTWRQFLQPIIALPRGDSIVDTIPITHGEVSAILQKAIQEQTTIGWNKLLVGLWSVNWKLLQDLIDCNNPNKPKRAASNWMNTAMHQFLKFSMRCWKTRNQAVHGITRQEQLQTTLQHARDRITAIYNDPPELAPRYRASLAVPLEHRLQMSLTAAEHWLSLIDHQARVTSHNRKLLISQHKPLHSHLRTMRKEARNQAKERHLPATPRKAHRRAVQAAVKEMRDKLYNWPKRSFRPRGTFLRRPHRQSNKAAACPNNVSRSGVKCPRPAPRHHPPWSEVCVLLFLLYPPVGGGRRNLLHVIWREGIRQIFLYLFYSTVVCTT